MSETQDRRPTTRLTAGRGLAIGAGVVVLVLGLAWMLVPWEWSTVDDPRQVLVMRAEVADRGPVGGAIHRAAELARTDRDGGIFRPAAWVYPPLIYQLPIEAAHVVRLLMLAVAILGPIIYVRRQGANLARTLITLLILLASATRLNQGLFLLSIQELSGAAFIGLGLAVRDPRLRTGLWIVSALFKSPFSWLLVGNAVVLWRRNQRLLAVVNAVAAAAILGISVWWSAGGAYSGRYTPNPLSPAVWSNARQLMDAEVVLLLLAFVWWVLITRTRLSLRPESVVFGIALAGYTVQMIPWSLSAYYLGPIIYLLGLLLSSVLTNPPAMPLWRAATSLAVPAAIAGFLVFLPLRMGFETNALLGDLRTCLTPLRAPSAVLSGGVWGYVTTSPEGPVRIVDSIRLEAPGWTGSLALEEPGLSGYRDAGTSHYVTFNDVALPDGRASELVCSSGQVDVYQLGPPNAAGGGY